MLPLKMRRFPIWLGDISTARELKNSLTVQTWGLMEAYYTILYAYCSNQSFTGKIIETIYRWNQRSVPTPSAISHMQFINCRPQVNAHLYLCVSKLTSDTKECMACRCCLTRGGIGLQQARTPLDSLGRTSDICATERETWGFSWTCEGLRTGYLL